ncbi:hypothetical protein F5050DRAFT_1905948 [Lentinula boryana]|uniref:Uncharacterized protein n=1 Tax=Lentinula boryana TaxID=40481 RepID=A0ABQ8Q0N8_9AGAR|nr:hypothetical protein F5050DRAFT_1905948 [Lentinula boryana]
MHQILPPRIWLSLCQTVWGVLTFCTSAVTNVQQLYAIRFCMAECSTFVGTHYILGSWYKPGELGKRSGSFTSSSLAGTLIDNWQLPVCEDMSKSNIRLSLGSSRKEHACSLLFAISGETESFGSNNLMGQWFKAVWRILCRANGLLSRWSHCIRNIFNFNCATWTDYTQVRWPVLVYMSGSCIFASIYILLWGSPTGLKFTLRALLTLDKQQLSRQDDLYAITIFLTAGVDGRIKSVLTTTKKEQLFCMWNNAWWSIVFYPATDTPNFGKGMIAAMIVICAATIAVTGLVWYLKNREHRLEHRLENRTTSKNEQELEEKQTVVR